jgi:hypothetical protein
MYTVAGNRLGVHDAPGGHLGFTMTHGAMTGPEAQQTLTNLNNEQRLFERPE